MTDRRRDDDPIIIGDAHNETLDVPTFSTPLAIVGGVSETDGVSPQIRDEDHVHLDHRALRVHDMKEDTPAGVPDRRAAPQIVNDFGAPYRDAPDGQSPYGQTDPFDAENRTTRVADGDGAVALVSSLERNVGSEDGRFARALTCVEFQGGPQSPKVKVPPDPPLPDGVAITEAGAVSGSGGVVVSSQPAVNVNGLRIEGQAAVEAAKEANRQGGTVEAIRDAALAAASAEQGGRDQPPVDVGQNLRTQTKKDEPDPPPQIPPAAGKPGGYVTGDGFKVGQLGTFFAPSSGEPMYPGSRGEAIGTLPGRWDAQWALDQERRGPLWVKDEDAAKIQELKGGILVKGWLQPDTTLKDTVGQLPGNTHALAVVVRIPSPIPGDGPPPERKPPPPEPPPPIGYLPGSEAYGPIVTVGPPPGYPFVLTNEDGTRWVFRHYPDNTLRIGKEMQPGAQLIGGVVLQPDGTVAQVDGDGSSEAGLLASPDGVSPPTVSAADAAALAADKDRSVIYVDSSSGVLSAVDPDGTVTALTGPNGAGGQAAYGLPGGNGSEGDYDPADGTTLAGGIRNFADFDVQAARTLNGTAGELHFVQVSGSATIAGTINLDGRGNAGGAGGAGSAGSFSTGVASAAGTAGTAGTGTKAAAAGGGGGGGSSGGSGSGTSGATGNGGAGGSGGNRGASWSSDGAGTAGSGGTGNPAGNTGGGPGGAGGNATAISTSLLARRISLESLAVLLGGAGGGGGGGGSGAADDSAASNGAGGAGGSGYDGNGNGNDGTTIGAIGGTIVAGGGGGGQGGRGGGCYVSVVRGNLTISGTINARGGTGGDGGSGGIGAGVASGEGGAGGGGSGGFVLFVAYGTIDLTGATFNVGGGAGGAGGSASAEVDGGDGGDGEDGFYAVVDGNTGRVVQWGGSIVAAQERTNALVSVLSTVSSAPADPLIQTAQQLVVPVDTSGGAFAVELPAADDVEIGDTVVLKDAGGAAGTNALTVDANAADTIDGGASTSLAIDDAALRIQKIAANTWMVV